MLSEVLTEWLTSLSLSELDCWSGAHGTRYSSNPRLQIVCCLRIDAAILSETAKVPIGAGTTLVPKEVYSKINWKSYTMATRKLLMAVFSRRDALADGKASPAFLSKPAKLCLDPEKVADIVMTVTANSHVKGSLVRSAITTKCADENKMLKLQMQKKQRQRTLEASAADKDLQEGAAAEVTSE
ncbi:Protein insensitive [Eumeta japonica]|uniref:Protein insensitive n=1 Tax=Eumeta variegata TaxID=151549 RepID=A0A4C1ZTC3_EUMVA|nr:Protein insensitive [Eumeta japonica]